MADTPLPPSAALRADANGDGDVTIADAGSWLAQLLCAPGDWLLWALAEYARPVAAFLGLADPTYGGLLSATISAAVWLLAFIAIVAVYGAIVEWDRRATSGFARLFADLRRRLRIAAVLLRARRSRAPPRDTRDTIEPKLDLKLAPLEVAILRELAELAPGYTASVLDVARALRLRADQVREPLDGLQKKTLVVRTIGGGEGDSAYRLSAGGRAALVLRQLAPRA